VFYFLNGENWAYIKVGVGYVFPIRGNEFITLLSNHKVALLSVVGLCVCWIILLLSSFDMTEDGGSL
jgi:hypothetical protein